MMNSFADCCDQSLNRRQMLRLMGLTGLSASFAASNLAFAGGHTDKRLVVIILRGALDGLHAVPPYAEKRYHTLRPKLGLTAPGGKDGILDLNGYFGLHSGFKTLFPLYKAGELAFIPASSSGYVKRSHFDGQNMLENGSGKPFGARDGWLNRMVGALQADEQIKLGLSIGTLTPLIFQGQNAINTWASSNLPEVTDDLLSRIAYTYEGDELFSSAISAARNAPDLDTMNGMKGGRNKDFEISAQAAGKILSDESGSRIAVMEINGWDTHFRQEARLDALFKQLSAGILTLRQELRSHWSNTAILVVSEFGRTAAENGSNGTDHGVGGLAMLAGGGINGGKIYGDWPGLGPNSLYEGRDVMPTTHYNSIFKAAMRDFLNLQENVIEDVILPNSGRIKAIEGIFRS